MSLFKCGLCDAVVILYRIISLHVQDMHVVVLINKADGFPLQILMPWSSVVEQKNNIPNNSTKELTSCLSSID